ncbi:2-oxoacid:acceptor oxidoreductase family protein [Cetobacterium ceti]
MRENIICAGFGGQGIMSLGKVIAYGGMLENKHVSWLPSYGAEMRGGTANCSVIVSDSPIGSPIITKNGTVAIVMNKPSLYKFQELLQNNGTIFINSSLIEEKTNRKDLTAYYVPATDISLQICGDIKFANMVMLGAFLAVTSLLKDELSNSLNKIFSGSKIKYLPLNLKAIEEGKNYIKNYY